MSALLVKKMRNLGYNCGYFKPVLSGLERRDNKLIPGDADFVCKVAGIEADPMDSVVYAFEPAVSPHLASRMANRPIIIGDMQGAVESGAIPASSRSQTASLVPAP